MSTKTERFSYKSSSPQLPLVDIDLDTIVQKTFGYLRDGTIVVPEEDSFQLYRPTVSPAIDELEVSVDRTPDGRISWSIVVPYELSKSVRASTMGSILQEKVFSCGLHDFTFGFLVETTDVKFSDVFGSDGEANSEQTPDYLKHMPQIGGYGLVEFFTSRVHEPERLIRNALDKVLKYEHSFRSRCKRKVKPGCMAVIGVSSQGVMTNLELASETVNELVLRYRIYDMVIDKALESQIIYENRGRRVTSKVVENMLTSVGKLDVPVYNKFSLTVEDQEFYKGDPSEEETDLLLLRAKRLSMPERCENLSYHTKGETRQDRKDVVLMPFFDTQPGDGFEFGDPLLESFGDTGTGRLWRQGLLSVRSNPERFKPDVARLEKLMSHLNVEGVPEGVKSTKEEMKSFHTFEGDLTEDEELELISQGIWGKSGSREPLVQELRKQKQKGFSIDTPTDDIEHFLSRYDLLKIDNVANNYLDDLETMEEETRGIQERVLLDSTKNGLQFRHTKLWRALNVMSLAAQEVAISFKQNRKRNEFIIKLLPDTPVWLLLKPTKGGSHMFFSMAVQRRHLLSRVDAPFRKCLETENWIFSEFASLKRDRVENFFRAPMLIATLCTFFCDTHNVNLKEFQRSPQSETSVVANILCCLLMNLENKEVSEEIVTLTRFMYMEATRFNPYAGKAQPSKIVKKLPTVVRSRFAMFLLKRVVRVAREMTLNPPVPVKVGCGETTTEALLVERDCWKGLVSFVDFSSLGSFRKALDLAYMGYFRSKDSGPDGNSSHKLIQKILEEELKLDKGDPMKYKGREEPEAEGTHTWSLKTVQMMASTFKLYMSQTFGKSWSTKLTEEIDSSLEDLSWNELATFKASSLLEASMEPPTLKKHANESHRKAINAVLAESRRDHPLDQLAETLDWLSKHQRGIASDLFMKQQHGGVREIYVLTMKSRIVQIVIEKLSRCLCNFVPFETMTHPMSKRKLIDDHHSQLHSISDKNWTTVYNSDDAKRWSQNFMMDQFLALFVNVLPNKYHKLIRATLNLWTNKAIKIPQGLINSYCRDNNIRFHSPEINMMLDQMSQGGDIVERGDNKMRIVSGFMQGILHYTSSFYHACCLMLSRRTILSTCMSLNVQVVVTNMVSSDDSGLIVSVRGSEEPEVLCRAAVAMCRIKRSFSTLAGILTSREKSTEASTTTLEFNSEFYNQHTHIKPRIKHVIAAHKVPTESSLINRSNGLSSLNSQLLEDGCPFNILSVVQYSQLEMHYRCLGMSVNPVFMQYWTSLLELPSPHLGFFMLDHPLMCGVAGSEFNHWQLQYKNNGVAGYLLHMMREYKDYGVRGTVDASFHVTQGNGKKFKALKDEARSLIGVEDPEGVFIEKPELLYSDPESLHESRLKIFMKYLNPALRDSLDNTHATSVSLASAVYFVSSHCIHPFLTDRMKEEEGDDLTGKICLSALVDHMRSKVGNDRCLTVMEEDFLFPLSQSYRDVAKLMSKFDDDPALVQVTRRRRKVVKITLESLQTPNTIRVTSLCGKIWFGTQYKKSRLQTQTEWKIMAKMVPWLKTTHKESLESSPFSSPIQMYNYLNTMVSRRRTLYISAPAVGFGRGVQMLPSVVKLNQHSYRAMRTDVRDTESLTSLDQFYIACSGPPFETEDSAKRSACKALMDMENPPISELMLSGSTAGLTHAASLYMQDKISSEDLKMILWRSKKCMMGFFSKRQNYVAASGKYTGDGSWVGSLMDLPVRLTIRGMVCTRVTTNDVRKLSYYVKDLKVLLFELGLTVDTHNTRGKLVFYFNGHAITRSGPGTLVTVEPRMTFQIPSSMKAYIEVLTEKHMGGYRPHKLLFKVGAGGRTSSNERYIAKTVHIQRNPQSMIPCSGPASDSVFFRPMELKMRTAWSEGVSLEEAYGFGYLLKSSETDSHLSEWVKTSFLMRARALQLDLSQNEIPDHLRSLPQVDEKGPTLSIADVCSIQMRPDMLEELAHGIEDLYEEGDMDKIEVFQAFQVDAETMGFLSEEIEESPTLMVEYRHRMWDEVISKMRVDCIESLNSVRKGSKISDSRLEQVLCWLMSKDRSRLAVESGINWGI